MTEIVSRGTARLLLGPIQPGHFKSKKHGAYSDRVITPLAAEIANAVCEARADLQAPEMQPAVLAYARSEAQLELLTAYVDQHGAFTGAGELTSAEKHRSAWTPRQPTTGRVSASTHFRRPSSARTSPQPRRSFDHPRATQR
ncbi:hypothetical protein GS539_19220 [Rhodococcus hoagii]|nr:hypothetical protein [Prescottella equi]